MAKEFARRDPARDSETSTPFLHMSTEGFTRRCQEMSGLPYLSLAAAYPLISPGIATARGPFSREVRQRSLLDKIDGTTSGGHGVVLLEHVLVRIVGRCFPRDQCLRDARLPLVHHHEESPADPHALGTVHAVAEEGGDGAVHGGPALSNDVPERGKLHKHSALLSLFSRTSPLWRRARRRWRSRRWSSCPRCWDSSPSRDRIALRSGRVKMLLKA